MKKRSLRLNSLLKEVISEVVRREVRDPRLSTLTTITGVEITADLRHAKVLVSIIGTDKERQETLEALESAAGFIAIASSKKVTMRHFPALAFKLDSSVDEQMRIDALLGKIHAEQQSRKVDPSNDI